VYIKYFYSNEGDQMIRITDNYQNKI